MWRLPGVDSRCDEAEQRRPARLLGQSPLEAVSRRRCDATRPADRRPRGCTERRRVRRPTRAPVGRSGRQRDRGGHRQSTSPRWSRRMLGPHGALELATAGAAAGLPRPRCLWASARRPRARSRSSTITTSERDGLVRSPTEMLRLMRAVVAVERRLPGGAVVRRGLPVLAYAGVLRGPGDALALGTPPWPGATALEHHRPVGEPAVEQQETAGRVDPGLVPPAGRPRRRRSGCGPPPRRRPASARRGRRRRRAGRWCCGRPDGPAGRRRPSHRPRSRSRVPIRPLPWRRT